MRRAAFAGERDPVLNAGLKENGVGARAFQLLAVCLFEAKRSNPNFFDFFQILAARAEHPATLLIRRR